MAGLMTIGEMARACGLSVRRLRHFEAVGLLSPARSAAARRVYGREEAARVHRILTLQQAGFTLRQIASITHGQPVPPIAMLDARIALLEDQRARIDQMIDRLSAARAIAGPDDALDFEGMCQLIRQGQDMIDNKGMQPVIDRYFTAEEQERWKAAGAQYFPPGAITEYGRQWSDLIERVDAARATGVQPASPEAQALLAEWLTLLDVLRDTMGDELVAKTGQMYAEMDQWQSPTRQGPFSADTFAFMTAANRSSGGGASGK